MSQTYLKAKKWMIIQIDCAMQFIIVLSLVKDTLDCLCTLCLNNDFIELKSKISRSHNVKIDIEGSQSY